MEEIFNDPVFRKLRSLDFGKLTLEERRKYDLAIKRYRDTMNVLDGAVQEGRAEGRAENQKEIGRNLKAMGMSVEDIAKATGLTPQQVAEL